MVFKDIEFCGIKSRIVYNYSYKQVYEPNIYIANNPYWVIICYQQNESTYGYYNKNTEQVVIL
jgi:hypothetical protein